MKKIPRLIALLAFIIYPLVTGARTFARWHTSMGSFTAELYDDLVPVTAENFRTLTNAGFYNNLIFHRVIQGFMIQDGCPNGTGTGGPGYTIPDEFHPDLLHDSAGILAMARTSAPNSAGSQYYITLAPTPHLNGGYAVFGKIISGLENVMAIGSVPTNASDRPITPVNIYQLRMLDLFIGNMYPPTTEIVELQPDESQMFITEAATNGANISYQWFLNEQVLEETGFMAELSFPTGGTNTLRCHIASSDSIAYDAIWTVQVASSNEDSQTPALQSLSLNTGPNPFSDAITIFCESKSLQHVSIDVFNVRGQKIRSLQQRNLKQGSWNLVWDGCDDFGTLQAKGLYLLRMKTDKDSIYRKLSKVQ